MGAASRVVAVTTVVYAFSESRLKRCRQSAVQTLGWPIRPLIWPRVTFFCRLWLYGTSTTSAVPSRCSSSTRTASVPLARTSATKAKARRVREEALAPSYSSLSTTSDLGSSPLPGSLASISSPPSDETAAPDGNISPYFDSVCSANGRTAFRRASRSAWAWREAVSRHDAMPRGCQNFSASTREYPLLPRSVQSTHQ